MEAPCTKCLPEHDNLRQKSPNFYRDIIPSNTIILYAILSRTTDNLLRTNRPDRIHHRTDPPPLPTTKPFPDETSTDSEHNPSHINRCYRPFILTYLSICSGVQPTRPNASVCLSVDPLALLSTHLYVWLRSARMLS